MGSADGKSRRGNKSDFYVTPFPCIEALLDNISITNKKILDPCCGTGIEKCGTVSRVIIESGFIQKINFFHEYDIISGKDFFNEQDYFDLIISNPPYSIKNRFIKKALLHANDIYFILPMDVCNYNEFHREFLDNELFLGKYLMTPKFFMTDKETYSPKRGGISAYAWFHWAGVYSRKKHLISQQILLMITCIRNLIMKK